MVAVCPDVAAEGVEGQLGEDQEAARGADGESPEVLRDWTGGKPVGLGQSLFWIARTQSRYTGARYIRIEPRYTSTRYIRIERFDCID